MTTQTAQTFVMSFLARCVRANTDDRRRAVTDSFFALDGVPAGAGAGTAGVPALDVMCLLPRWRHSWKRMVLVDFEGTVCAREEVRGRLPAGAETAGGGGLRPFDPPEEVYALLGKLAADEHNSVWLLSGLPVRGAMEVVAARVPKLGIVSVAANLNNNNFFLLC